MSGYQGVGGFEIRILAFDGATLNHIGASDRNLAVFGSFVDFDPSGKYLAVGDLNGNVNVYSFDSLTGLLSLSSIIPSYIGSGSPVKSGQWSSGGYLAIGRGGEVEVVKFDGPSLPLIQYGSFLLNSPADRARDVSWDSSGRYLAVAIASSVNILSQAFRVLEFNGETLIPIVDYDHGDGINLPNGIRAAGWSQDDLSLIIGGWPGSGGYDVRKFDVKGASVIDRKVTIDSKVDELGDCQETVNSQLDALDVGLITTIDSKVDEMNECCATVHSKVDVFETKVDLLGYGKELITSSTIITKPGFYEVGNNIEGYIIIDSDSVHIDLNGFLVTTTMVPPVQVNSNWKNIVIENGSIQGAGQDGILIQDGASSVVMKDLHISECDNGIHFDALTGTTIKCCRVNDCILYDCNKGVEATNMIKTTFENVDACNCYEAGFEMTSCSYNVFYRCKAMKIESDEWDKWAVGFMSTSGIGNLFKECIADCITTTSGRFCRSAKGFWLKGTDEIEGEYGTKIVNCLVDSINSTSLGNAYGIHLEEVLKGTNPLITPIIDETFTDSQWAVSWSPTYKFVAVGGQDRKIRVYYFDIETQMLSLVIETADLGLIIYSLAWSPDGKFLAAGLQDGDLFLYSFDPSSLDKTKILDQIDSKSLGGIGRHIWSLDWTSDGLFLGVAIRNTGIKIFGFDSSSLTNQTIGDAPIPINSKVKLGFSPDDRFLAYTTNNNALPPTKRFEIYRFDPKLAPNALQHKVTQSITFVGEPWPIAWSPIGCAEKYFIAVGEFRTLPNPGEVEIFSYDGETSVISLGSANHSRGMYTIMWSPDGKYVFACGLRQAQELSIFKFDASASTALTIEYTGNFPNGDAYDLDISPDGRYLAVVGATGSFYNFALYDVANVPLKCIIENNKVCNCAGGLGGIGISGASGSSLIIKNIAYNNCINLTPGVFNKYLDGLNGSQDNGFENISIPPYDV